MNTAQLAIQHYILAKDANRPHWLSRAFVPEAILDRVVRTITIEHMKTLPAADLDGVMKWVSGLSYPGRNSEAAVGDAPDIEAIGKVIQYITA